MTETDRIGQTFAACRSQGRAALVGYLTAFDPDEQTSLSRLRTAVSASVAQYRAATGADPGAAASRDTGSAGSDAGWPHCSSGSANRISGSRMSPFSPRTVNST
ncbi:MAG: hypothetical protein K0V04_19305, partial [Deltaproteobacteria bacterium]|nr:hypothetical protein [Deltaproteobacteria bacterium]